MVLLPACGSSSSTTRTVLADYDFDAVPSGSQAFFPRALAAHPGDTIVFKQSWSGDPHTVTLGRLVDHAVLPLAPYLKGLKPLPPDPKKLAGGFDALPSFFDPDVNQLAAQPCYLAHGPLPEGSGPCPKPERTESDFHGTETFFNSGFIPFQGLRGNRFTLKLAPDIKPGEYAFNCLVHGPQMSGVIDVFAASKHIGGQAQINADAQRQIRRFDSELSHLHAATTNAPKPDGADIVAGASANQRSLDGYDDREFFPETFHARVGQRVTWFISTEPAHTVSFDVPRYLPVIITARNGDVQGNPETTEPRNGPGYPTSGVANDNGDPATRPPPSVDVGNYDGAKFLSSGASFEGPMLYSIAFSRPGTYHYACLLHPRMVGEIVVS